MYILVLSKICWKKNGFVIFPLFTLRGNKNDLSWKSSFSVFLNKSGSRSYKTSFFFIFWFSLLCLLHIEKMLWLNSKKIEKILLRNEIKFYLIGHWSKPNFSITVPDKKFCSVKLLLLANRILWQASVECAC